MFFIGFGKRLRLMLQTRDFELKIRDLQKIDEFDAEVIRENQAICANLRIDSRESAHLR